MTEKKDYSNYSEQDWRAFLSDEAYQVTRHAATEPPFTGEFLNLKDAGTYTCVCCKTPLFVSEFKFDSGCGWPSFFSELPDAKITRLPDYSHGRTRVEIRCSTCDAHLGHVFQDGPPPTGERYCVNSVAMDFTPLNPKS